MRIAVNKENEIYLFDQNDVLTPAIEIDESILPDDFFSTFAPGYYVYQDNKVIKNPDFVKPDSPSVEPTNMNNSLTAQAAVLATIQQMLMAQAANIAKLKQGGA
ncbi:DUF2977 domain-containing protein [Lactiplantibacillus plantarum]|uniref:DUF2977 domain-containing protein n=1 Tax=Lactiplantibacillus plantarum TaxID=1590 RepID=UPI001E406CC2|nr:DUF2977 domain-containing protein [Lactiplantibacillus plantarum]MCC6120600.1 DUF2977 domain-containing protein [Lactiplantibacillus plantarum]MCW6137083.1 DUF2977 domain-containing protein [Lactiplantibacillus plantarum]